MNNTNISVDIEWDWVPFTWTWWVIVQLAFSIVGIVGNILVIAVIIRRSPAQFATDVLIGNLAVSDFFTSLWMIPRPQMDSVPSNWKGMLYCRIEYSNSLMWISAVASVFILTVISVERLVAVKHPLKFKLIFTVKRSLHLVGFSWLGAAILNMYTLAISTYDGESHICRTESIGYEVQMAAGVLLFMFKYLIPIIIMISSHLAIIRALRAHARSFQTDGRTVNQPVQQLSLTMRRMTRTLLIVVIFFIVCWSPDQICFLLFNLELHPSYMYSDHYRVFVCLAFVNSCSNPFIYSVRNKKFRNELLDLLCLLPSKRKELAPVFSTLVKSRYIKTISGKVPV